MNREELINIITKELLRTLAEEGKDESIRAEKVDAGFIDDAVVQQMKTKTPARIGVGKAGPRLRTNTLLKLRADHACAKDAVLRSVDDSFLERIGLFKVQSKCRDIQEHLTRPDLGRQLSEEAVMTLKEKCIKSPQVQIYISDGLSNMAVENNVADLLPVLTEGLKDRGIETGTPFFLKYGRVPTMDQVSEVVSAELTCVLIGERPGLAAADSLSAYITYRARVGIPESKRTVISNIHERGIQPVEAGAYAVDVICEALKRQATGVDLKL